MVDLEPVPEDWTRALAVVAHPDDLEYGAAAAIARWTGQGKEVAYCLVTSGEAGIDSMPPDECARVRQAEERASAAAVGVGTVEFLSHPDGLVEASLVLRRDLAAAIRRHRPEVVISINFRESFGGPGFNHADHRNTGLALLDAVRDAANRWLFVGAGGDAWSGVRFALFGGSPQAAHGVDVGATIDRGVASLREHRTYLNALPAGTTGTDPDAFLRAMAAQAGPRLGVDLATAFELIPLG
ncbi:PIG-L deacetylase family protein [Aquihabitans sp. McL0605]|uniref:PIG-L deacetylase family protein n=1 Tax=Aquihabitans sp. McL0605 TaxID=3415671 RepID=UPI003CF1D868